MERTRDLQGVTHDGKHRGGERGVARRVGGEGGVNAGPLAVGVGRAQRHPCRVLQLGGLGDFVGAADADDWSPEVVLILVPPRLHLFLN